MFKIHLHAFHPFSVWDVRVQGGDIQCHQNAAGWKCVECVQFVEEVSGVLQVGWYLEDQGLEVVLHKL